MPLSGFSDSRRGPDFCPANIEPKFERQNLAIRKTEFLINGEETELN